MYNYNVYCFKINLSTSTRFAPSKCCGIWTSEVGKTSELPLDLLGANGIS